MSKLLFANWKMSPGTESDVKKLVRAADAANVVLFPSTVFLPIVSKAVKKARFGVQDIFWNQAGVCTGEVSAAQVLGYGATHVIVGHSERRVTLGESDEVVARKLAAALEQGLTPILCIGETAQEHEAQRTREVIDRQLRSAFSLLPADFGTSLPLVYIAYEPVWAVSSMSEEGGVVAAAPEDVQAVIHYMQGIIRGLPITPLFLYGGSVDSKTIGGFLSLPEVSGALVGAASLRAAEFKQMVVLAQGTPDA